MKRIWSAVLYTALVLGANGAIAADTAALEALKDGSMKKLVFASEPDAVSEVPFTDPEGGEPPVEADRGVDRLHHRIRTRREAAAPHRIRGRLTCPRGTGGRRPHLLILLGEQIKPASGFSALHSCLY